MVKKISHVEFVKTWKEANSIGTVASATGLSKQSVQARAAKLRKAGVALPRFARQGEPIDVDALNAILGEKTVVRKRRTKK